MHPDHHAARQSCSQTVMQPDSHAARPSCSQTVVQPDSHADTHSDSYAHMSSPIPPLLLMSATHSVICSFCHSGPLSVLHSVILSICDSTTHPPPQSSLAAMVEQRQAMRATLQRPVETLPQLRDTLQLLQTISDLQNSIDQHYLPVERMYDLLR